MWLPRRRAPRHVERGGERGAARGADEDALLRRQLARQPHRFVAVHRHDLVDQPLGQRLFGEARDEVRAPALHQVRAEHRMARRRLAAWRRAAGRCRCRAAARCRARRRRRGSRHRPPSARGPRRAACRRCRSRRRRRGSARPAKSARISRAVVRVCTSALASLSNWRQRNQPCFSASSMALFSMPVPFSAAGVSTTRAPRKRRSLRRSTLKLSAIVSTSG